MAIFALIIGINEYVAGDHFATLQGAVNDARAFENFLLEDLKAPATNIVILLDGNATRANILSTLQSHLVNNPDIVDGGNAMISIFFAGHGARINASDNPLAPDGVVEVICPVDERTTNAAGEYVHAIPDYVLRRFLGELAAKKGPNITVILDCCYSGGMSRDEDIGRDEGIARTAYSSSRPVPHDLDSHLWESKNEIIQSYCRAATSHVLLAACGEEETAREIRHDHNKSFHGRFTDNLIRGLRNLPLERTTYTELVDQLPRWSGQTPYCSGSNRDRLVFGGNYPATHRRVLPLTPNTSVDPKDPDTVQSFRVEMGSGEGPRPTIRADELMLVSFPINASTKTMDGLALLTTLLAGTAAQILHVIWADDEIKDVTGAAMTALNFLSYAAIVLNLLATTAAVFLKYQLRHITRNEIRTGGNRPIEGNVDTEKSVFGAGRMVQFLSTLAMLSALLGILSIYGEVLIYVLLCDGPAMSLVLTGLTVLTMAMLAWTFTCSYRTSPSSAVGSNLPPLGSKAERGRGPTADSRGTLSHQGQ